MNAEKKCPRCPDTAPRRVFSIAPGNDVLECARCALQYAQHCPEPEDADSQIYSYEYFRPVLEKARQRETFFTALVEELESYTYGRGRLLEIGLGDGALARTAGNRGWRVEGTEISTAMVHHLRQNLGLTVHHGILEDLPLEEQAYDAVVLHHVLEHLKDPFATLGKVGRLLRHGGIVRIEVPNLASFSSRWKNFQSRYRLKRHPWKHYATGHHFWYFTPRTLVHVMETSGLHVLTTSAPIDQWGERSPVVRLANPLFARLRLGGRLVAYGSRV